MRAGARKIPSGAPVAEVRPVQPDPAPAGGPELEVMEALSRLVDLEPAAHPGLLRALLDQALESPELTDSLRHALRALYLEACAAMYLRLAVLECDDLEWHVCAWPGLSPLKRSRRRAPHPAVQALFLRPA